MISFTLTMKVDRPVEAVFDYVTDRANLSQWFSGVVSAQQHGPNQVGTKTTVRVRMMGISMEAVSEVTVFEPNRRFGIRGGGPFPFDETETFTSIGDGAQIEYRGDYHIKGFYRLVEPLVARMVERQVTASYARLKKILELREG